VAAAKIIAKTAATNLLLNFFTIPLLVSAVCRPQVSLQSAFFAVLPRFDLGVILGPRRISPVFTGDGKSSGKPFGMSHLIALPVISKCRSLPMDSRLDPHHCKAALQMKFRRKTNELLNFMN
jgi:hypothetical protein